MNRIRNATRNLSKNRNKGFTLVELIVVILIIAILAAVLTPSIMGVIDRANDSADTSLGHGLIIAGSAAGLMQDAANLGTAPGADAIVAQLTHGNISEVTWKLYFEDSVAVGAFVQDKSKEGVWVGTNETEAKANVESKTWAEVLSPTSNP